MIKQVSLHSEGRFQKLYLLNFAQSRIKSSNSLVVEQALHPRAQGALKQNKTRLRLKHWVNKSLISNSNIFMKLFSEYFIKYLEKHQKIDDFYDFSWVIYGSFFMKNHEISPNIAHFSSKMMKYGSNMPKNR